MGVQALGYLDERYPARLRELSDAPPLLYVAGDAAILARERLVAVVGTREPTRIGEHLARELTGALAAAGWGIVSGLAKGIDTVAHTAAFEHGAPTIAVMGGGLDRIYPPENQGLAAEIAEQGGALLSEHPPDARASRRGLIARDRLQSALSVAVLLVESELEGGAMHTARFAACQGRPLLCPTPQERGGAGSAGVRTLLESPARELCARVPAWKRSQALCARLGTLPLAREVGHDDVEGLLGAVEAAACRSSRRKP